MNFGNIIKQLRIEKKWTQEFVAEKLNISIGALSRYESSMYEPKSLDLLKDFANLFDVSTDYLLGNTASRKKYTNTEGTLIGKVASKIEKMDDDELELFSILIDKITKDKK